MCSFVSYNHKFARGGMRINTIQNALAGSSGEKCGFLYARRVKDTLKNFIASADWSVKAEHVPPVPVYPTRASKWGDVIGNDHRVDVGYFNSYCYVKVRASSLKANY